MEKIILLLLYIIGCHQIITEIGDKNIASRENNSTIERRTRFEKSNTLKTTRFKDNTIGTTTGFEKNNTIETTTGFEKNSTIETTTGFDENNTLEIIGFEKHSTLKTTTFEDNSIGTTVGFEKNNTIETTTGFDENNITEIIGFEKNGTLNTIGFENDTAIEATTELEKIYIINVLGFGKNNTIKAEGLEKNNTTGTTTEFEKSNTTETTTEFEKNNTTETTTGFENSTLKPTEIYDNFTNGNISTIDDNVNNTTDNFTTNEIPTTPPPVSLNKLFPNVFQTKIRIFELHNSGYHYQAVVSYDLKNNRASFTVNRRNSIFKKIYNFNENHVLNINDTNCNIEEISDKDADDPFFLFPFDAANSQKLMKEPSSFFRLDQEYNESENETSVDGLLCKKFETWIELENNTACDIEHYFTNSTGKANETLIPVRTYINCGDRCEIYYNFSLMIMFLDFKEEITSFEEFQQSPGVYCLHITTEKFSHLQDVALHMDVMENYFRTFDNSYRIQIWYNRNMKILREIRKKGHESFSIITDYNYNVSREIKQTDGYVTCKLRNIEEQEEEITVLDFIWKINNYKIQKVGNRTCGLIQCEIWTGFIPDSKLTFDIYLKKEDLCTQTCKYVPVLIDLFERKYDKLRRYKQWTFFEYKSIIGEWSVFDISSCFNNEQLYNFKLSIENSPNDDNAWRDPSFREDVYHFIWKKTNLISPLRLRKIKIFPDEDETIGVYGYISENNPDIKIVPACNDIDVITALENLKTAVNETLDFNSTDIKQQLTIASVQVNISNIYIDQQKFRKKYLNGKKYSSGDMAGLGIGMMIVGILCCVPILLVLTGCKCKKKSS